MTAIKIKKWALSAETFQSIGWAEKDSRRPGLVLSPESIGASQNTLESLGG